MTIIDYIKSLYVYLPLMQKYFTEKYKTNNSNRGKM